MSEFETILTDVTDGVATITINRPKALNALNLQVLTDITDAATAYDADDSVKAIIITGSEKAFAAGADIKEMSSLDFSTAYKADWFAGWTRLTDVRKPVITAVGGYALGGGCELAMMGDILIASTKAKFGQPPLLAIVPKFVSSSSRVIPTPLSIILMVRFSLSISIFISNESLLTFKEVSVKDK